MFTIKDYLFANLLGGSFSYSTFTAIRAHHVCDEVAFTAIKDSLHTPEGKGDDIFSSPSSFGAVYTPPLLTSNETLLLGLSLPLTWQWLTGSPETAKVWNWVPQWNLLTLQPSLQLFELASGVPVNVAMLMLMLAQVNAFRSSHYQSLSFRLQGGQVRCDSCSVNSFRQPFTPEGSVPQAPGCLEGP